MNAYVKRVLGETKEKNVNEPEFLQTVEEILSSLAPVVDARPEYKKAGPPERMVEPERTIELRVAWIDDAGKVNVNRGYRVQYNGAIRPYKGGLRSAPSVTPSVIRLSDFEQTSKNSLTTLPMGGAKGGSDFDPRDRSDAETMCFCQPFMTELYRHIDPDINVPTGDLGVGEREVVYIYDQYHRIRGAFENGAIIGKGRPFGGSLIRPEATGYGAIYYVDEVLKHENDSTKDKTFAVSGFSNVAWGAVKKIAELDGKAVAISGPDGYVYDPDGIVTDEKINLMLDMHSSGHDKVQDYADKSGVEFFPGEKPWGRKADIVLLCATQNNINMDEAKKTVANGTRYYIEVVNMPTTNDVLVYLMGQKSMIVAPSKAVNAGGVTVSGLKMSQNSERLSWTEEEVDQKLHQIMKSTHDTSVAAAEELGLGYNPVIGANIADFKKVADAILAQGIF